jgi:hypothetical protein
MRCSCSLRAVLSLLLVSVPLSVVADQLQYVILPAAEIEQRLRNYKGDNSKREANLKALFATVGCLQENLSEQPVANLKQPNIICKLPGETDSVILVGAHFDRVNRGDGVIDNWSGASLLPSLYQALSSTTRRHTFIFVSFAGEEEGLVGSQFFVRSLAAGDLSRIKAMVNMDSLALGPTEVWVSHSDSDLVRWLNTMAYSLKLPLKGMDVERIGRSDEEPFIEQHIPAVTIHSVTQRTLEVLHSPRDNYSAVSFKDYYDTYRLLCAYLAFLDEKVLSHPPPNLGQ